MRSLLIMPVAALCALAFMLTACDHTNPPPASNQHVARAETTTRPASAGARAPCVVCSHGGGHMDMEVTADTPRTDYNGKTYYFCSPECKDIFLKNPDKYAPKP